MNIQGGGLSFEIDGYNKKLIQVLEESKQAIQNTTRTTTKSADDIDAAFSAAANTINKGFEQIDAIVNVNNEALRELKAQYQGLKSAAAEAFMKGDDKQYGILTQKAQALEGEIRLRERIIQQAEQAADELQQEEQSINRQKEAMQKSADASTSLRQQLRKVVEELALMEAAGKRDTEEFRELQKEAGRLTNAMGDARTQARIFSHDNANLQGVISGIHGVTGAFTVAQGAVALFGKENEDLQKTMLKVQAAMSITMGLQQVFNTLNKDSAFMLTTVAKAKDLLTAANKRLAVALGISTGAATALMAALTLGLSVAITAVIALISKMSSKAEEAKKATDAMRKAFIDYHNATATNAGNLVGKFQKLRQEYQSLKTTAEKKEWIDENKTAFEGLELAVTNVTDADNVFVNNTSKVIKALELRAKAMALQELQTKAYEEYYKSVINADNSVAGGGYYSKFKGGNFFTASGKIPEEWEKAGVTDKEAGYEWGGGQSGAGTFKPTQAAIDKINAYRMQQARETNKTIHKEARGELDKTINYVEKELTTTQGEIQKLNILSAGVGKDNGKNGGNKNTPAKDEDPFVSQLNQRKEAYRIYAAWVQSEDETVRSAAQTEFAELLKGGTSYIDYLENARDSITQKANKSAADLKNLSTLNNEIANETKKTVLSDFETQLNAELQKCETIAARLALLEQKKNELSGDNSEIDNAKGEIISNAQDEAKKQAKEETKALLQQYSSYLTEKLQFDATYANKKQLLERAKQNASNEAERRQAEAALNALETERKAYEGRTSSEEYDKLLQQYRTYEQQKADITKKYAEQRTIAEQQNDLAMLSQINSSERAELSKLAAQRVMASESWTQLFADLTTLSARTINKLMADINAQKVTLSAQFNPNDLKAIEDRLEKAKEELHKRNPFLALKDGLAELREAMTSEKLLNTTEYGKQLQELKKQYDEYSAAITTDDETKAKAAKTIYADLLSQGSTYLDALRRKLAELEGKKITIGLDVEGEEQLTLIKAALKQEEGQTKSVSEGIKDTFKSVGSSIDFIKGAFDSVIGGMKKMGITMDDETEVILNDIGGMMQGASDLATGIATGNPLSIISGSVNLLSSAIDMFNSGDRKAERSIKRHQEAIKQLSNAYTQLEHNIKHALGEEIYRNQNAQIRNLRQQQRELNEMISDEQGKKHTDWDRISEWQEQIREAGREIEDIIAEISENITQTTGKELAQQLSDALVEAFGNGEDAAKSFGEIANDALKNAVANAIKLKILEPQLQKAIDQLRKDMGFDEEGNGSFDGLTEEEQKRFKQAVEAAGANFQAAMDVYKDLFNELDSNDPTTLSGAIKGASQESIDLLAGQTNAVRVNQVTAIGLVRQQLEHLASMDTRLATISTNLITLLRKIDGSGEDLRSQGLNK
jgi:hypothetical protein